MILCGATLAVVAADDTNPQGRSVRPFTFSQKNPCTLESNEL